MSSGYAVVVLTAEQQRALRIAAQRRIIDTFSTSERALIHGAAKRGKSRLATTVVAESWSMSSLRVAATPTLRHHEPELDTASVPDAPSSVDYLEWATAKIAATAQQTMERLGTVAPSEQVSAALTRLAQAPPDDAAHYIDVLNRAVAHQLVETDLKAELEWMTKVTSAIRSDESLNDTLQPSADRLLTALETAQPTQLEVSQLRTAYDALEGRYYKELEAQEKLRQWKAMFSSLGVEVISTPTTLTIVPGQSSSVPDNLAYRITSVGNGAVDGELLYVTYRDPATGASTSTDADTTELLQLCDFVHRHTGLQREGGTPSPASLSTYEVSRHSAAATEEPAQMTMEFDR